MKNSKLLKIVTFGLLLFASIYLFLSYGHYLTLESLKESQVTFQETMRQSPGKIEVIYFIIYVVSTAISLPGAAILTLAGGAFFGFTKGLILVSFASTLGATGSFLIARYLFRDWFRSKFAAASQKIDAGFQKEGTSYLISLRLIPIFPFFAINSLMGLTGISVFKYYLISQLAMLPATAIYVWAGLEIAAISSLADIISPEFLLVSTLLGLLPWLLKQPLEMWKRRKLYAPYKKPKKFDYNVIVIGAGAAGLVSTAIARAVKAKVAIIEKHHMGGDCLNFGCVPSKALIHYANSGNQKSYADIQIGIQKIIQKIAPHDSEERFRKMGADVFKGQAFVKSPYEVEINSQTLTTRNIILATGAEPLVPNVQGLHHIKPLTSESLWDVKDLPKKLMIIGGGPIGCELAMAFQKLGSQVILVEKSERLLAHESKKAGLVILGALKECGVQVMLNSSLQEFLGPQIAKIEAGGTFHQVEFDQVLFAVGRKPRTAGFGLENLPLEFSKEGRLQHNKFLQTNFPNIFACGDLISPLQLTHVAGHQAWYAAVNSLFGTFRKFPQDLTVIPRVTFTHPEVASVGINQETAVQKGLEFEVTHFPMDDFDRAICDQETAGFIEIITKKGTDKILGVTIVSSHAGELLTEFTFAMRWGLGLKKILSTVHAYPTWSDANKLAALEWQRARIPHKLLSYVEKYHNWKRA